MLTCTQAAVKPWESFFAEMQGEHCRLTTALLALFKQYQNLDWMDYFTIYQIGNCLTSMATMKSIRDLDSSPNNLCQISDVLHHFDAEYLQVWSYYYTPECIFIPEHTLLDSLHRWYSTFSSNLDLDSSLDVNSPAMTWTARAFEDHWEDIYTQFEELLEVKDEKNLMLICYFVGVCGDKSEEERLRRIFRVFVQKTAFAKLSRVIGDGLPSLGNSVACAGILLDVEQEMIEMTEMLELKDGELKLKLTFYPEMGAPWDIIQEIFDEHPQWQNVLSELRAQREMASRSGIENAGSTIVPEAVADETVSRLDSISTFFLTS
jgi:hypothetical protein